MSEKTIYKIKPIIRIGERNILEVLDFNIRLLDEERGRVLSTYINEEESVLLISYLLDRLENRYKNYLNNLRKELEMEYKKQYEVINKASRTEICRNKGYCIATMEEYSRKIEIINNEIDSLINEINKVKYLINKIKECLSAIRYILNLYKVEIEQDFVLI